jgi:hypothetical protein
MKKLVIFAIRYSIIQFSASSWESAKLDNNDCIDKILSPTRITIREKLFEKLILTSLSDLIKSVYSETESTILLMISDLRPFEN